MGMFKDLKDMMQVARSPELKELKEKAKDVERPSMMDSVRQANQLLDDLKAQGVDLNQGVTSINGHVWTGDGTMNGERMDGSGGGAETPFGTPMPASEPLRGVAEVQSTQDTGKTIDGHPVVEAVLKVTLADDEPYTITHRQAIPISDMAKWQAGSTKPVRVDPNDRSQVLVG